MMIITNPIIKDFTFKVRFILQFTFKVSMNQVKVIGDDEAVTIISVDSRDDVKLPTRYLSQSLSFLLGSILILKRSYA